MPFGPHLLEEPTAWWTRGCCLGQREHHLGLGLGVRGGGCVGSPQRLLSRSALAKAAPGCSSRGEGVFAAGRCPPSVRPCRVPPPSPRCFCQAGARPSTPAASCGGGSGCAPRCYRRIPPPPPQHASPRGPAAPPPRGARGRAGPSPLPVRRRTGRALPPPSETRAARGAEPVWAVPARLGSAPARPDLAPPARPRPRLRLRSRSRSRCRSRPPMGSAARRRPGSRRQRGGSPGGPARP